MRSKYGNLRTRGFPSRKEANRHTDLLLLERAGAISALERQVSFHCIVNGVEVCRYIADFVYTERGERVVEDVKGFPTPIYRLKKKLMFACHGVTIKET